MIAQFSAALDFAVSLHKISASLTPRDGIKGLFFLLLFPSSLGSAVTVRWEATKVPFFTYRGAGDRHHGGNFFDFLTSRYGTGPSVGGSVNSALSSYEYIPVGQ